MDPKRSNTINIGMTKLPPSRTIKTAILKMDSTIINREGIEVIKRNLYEIIFHYLTKCIGIIRNC